MYIDPAIESLNIFYLFSYLSTHQLTYFVKIQKYLGASINLHLQLNLLISCLVYKSKTILVRNRIHVLFILRSINEYFLPTRYVLLYLNMKY